MKITLSIITLNEESRLDACLRSVRGIVDEIVVVDSGSTDGTEEIARSYGARFVHQDWLGFVGQKNHALGLASHPWVLSLDGDEAVSEELFAEIEQLRSGSEIATDVGGFSMPRCVLYEGRWIRHGDWYPDRLVRLFRRAGAKYAGGKVHERLEIKGAVSSLRGDLHHFSFADRTDHWLRCQKYARLWAESQWEAGKQVTALSPWSHGIFRWLRGYVIRCGFLDGPQGWHIAMLSAREVHLKYRLLRQMNRT